MLSRQPVILFLYSELAGYFLACVRILQELYNTDVHIIHWSINKEAPFNLVNSGNINIYDRNSFNKKELIELAKSIKPDVIFSSGWVDTGYIGVCRVYKDIVPTVIGFDNKWNGNVRQQIARAISPWLLHRAFNIAWVPGSQQEEYARKLGFKKDRIEGGFYSADVNYFNSLCKQFQEEKNRLFPKRFIYVGRYVEHKGVRDLWEAFEGLSEDERNGWELWSLGTGELANDAVVHPHIHHFGFVQPLDLDEYIRKTGVFVLPSHFEPWGVALHEFAAAGFPVICSEEVGAAECFCEDGKNGYSFPVKNVKALRDVMIKMINHSPEDLIKMGEHSFELSQKITPKKWADTLMRLLEEK